MQLAVKKFGPVEGGVGDVILIHGTGARAEMWMPQIKMLEEHGFRSFVPDLRGHGESPEPREQASIEVHLNDVLETLGSHDIRYPAIFVGHSLGSIISLELAQRYPDMFERILAVAMPGRVPQTTVTAFKALMGAPYTVVKKTGMHQNFAWRERVLFETNHFSLSQILENFADLNYVDNVPSVSCPVHFVVSRWDVVAPWQHVKTMHKAIPNSTFELIEWAGHNCMDSQPESFNKWFLDRLRRSTF